MKELYIDARYRKQMFQEAANMWNNKQREEPDWLGELPAACCGKPLSAHAGETDHNLDMDTILEVIAEHLLVLDICQLVLEIAPEFGIAIISRYSSARYKEEPPLKMREIIGHYKSLFYYEKKKATQDDSTIDEPIESENPEEEYEIKYYYDEEKISQFEAVIIEYVARFRNVGNNKQKRLPKP